MNKSKQAILLVGWALLCLAFPAPGQQLNFGPRYSGVVTMANPSNIFGGTFAGDTLFVRAVGPSPGPQGSYFPKTALPGEGLLVEFSTEGTNWNAITPDGSWLMTNGVGLRDEGFFNNYTNDGFFYVCFSYQPAALVGPIGCVKSHDLIHWTPIGSADGNPGTIVNEGGIASPEILAGANIRGTNLLYYTTFQSGNPLGVVKVRQQLDATFTNWSAATVVVTNEKAIGQPLNDAFFLVLGSTVYCYVESTPDQSYDIYSNSVSTFPATMHLFATNIFEPFGTNYPASNIREAVDIMQLPNGLWRAYGAGTGPGGYGYLVASDTNSPFGPWTNFFVCGESPRLTFGQSTVTLLSGVPKNVLQAAIALAATNGPTLTTVQTTGQATLTSALISNRFQFATKGLTYATSTNLQVDLATGNFFTVTLTNNCYFPRPVNENSGQTFTVLATQDATGGRTITFDTNYWVFIGTSNTFNTTANAVNLFACVTDPPATGVLVLNNSSAVEPVVSPVIAFARAAWSLRNLGNPAITKAINVRRSSDNTTNDIGFVGNDLDTAALTTFCGAGNGFVVKWYDQSGNGNDLSQATTANQPKVYSSGSVVTGANSKAAAQFGSPVTMASPAITISTGQYMAYTVCSRPWTSATYAGLMESANYGASAGIALLVSSGGLGAAKDVLCIGNGFGGTAPYCYGVPTGTAADNTSFLFTSVIGASGTGCWRDSTNITGTVSQGAMPTVTSVLNIGSGSATDYFDGKLQEFVIWDNNYTAGVQAAIRTSIDGYYNLY